MTALGKLHEQQKQTLKAKFLMTKSAFLVRRSHVRVFLHFYVTFREFASSNVAESARKKAIAQKLRTWL